MAVSRYQTQNECNKITILWRPSFQSRSLRKLDFRSFHVELESHNQRIWWRLNTWTRAQSFRFILWRTNTFWRFQRKLIFTVFYYLQLSFLGWVVSPSPFCESRATQWSWISLRFAKKKRRKFDQILRVSVLAKRLWFLTGTTISHHSPYFGSFSLSLACLRNVKVSLIRRCSIISLSPLDPLTFFCLAVWRTGLSCWDDLPLGRPGTFDFGFPFGFDVGISAASCLS